MWIRRLIALGSFLNASVHAILSGHISSKSSSTRNMLLTASIGSSAEIQGCLLICSLFNRWGDEDHRQHCIYGSWCWLVESVFHAVGWFGSRSAPVDNMEAYLAYGGVGRVAMIVVNVAVMVVIVVA